VDLGCGSGLWAEELARARYRVLGIDISEAMIEIARRRVSDAEFRVGSLFEAEIPPCVAVTSLGEVLNYLFDPNNDGQRLVGLFRCVYSALAPGGVFVFDVAEPGQVARGPQPGDSPKERIGSWCSKRRRMRSGGC
jgi:SAM-dependent methyltransferase